MVVHVPSNPNQSLILFLYFPLAHTFYRNPWLGVLELAPRGVSVQRFTSGTRLTNIKVLVAGSASLRTERCRFLSSDPGESNAAHGEVWWWISHNLEQKLPQGGVRRKWRVISEEPALIYF